MNRKRALIIILILFTGLFPLIPIPIAKAKEATVSIQESEDDVWMTESGNIFGYEASVRILEPEIGIRSFLRFEDVPLLKSSKINVATLNVYAGWDQGETISPGAMVTIYGIDEPDCAPFSYSGRVWSLERPYTSASVNWNVSYWPQSTWQAVNVTSIVKEIINQYAWVQNNSIGFQILGASDSGYEYRTFEDIDHQHHGAYAYLYFQYDIPPGTPPGLPDTAVWEETYGEVDIWSVPGGFNVSFMEYVFCEGTASPYEIMYDTIDGAGPYLISETEMDKETTGSAEKLARTSNGTIYAVYSRELGGNHQIYIKKSIDEGITWIDETRVSIADGMGNYLQAMATIEIDSNDVIHIAWIGKASGVAVWNKVWYVNYTTEWGDISVVTGVIGGQFDSVDMVIDSNVFLHMVMVGSNGATDKVWYLNYTTEWSTPLDVSTYPGMSTVGQFQASIAIDSDDLVHIVWGGPATGFPDYQIWYANGTFQTPIRVSTAVTMDTEVQWEGDIAIDSEDVLHIVWQGTSSGYANRQVWYVNRTLEWGSIIRISTATGMENQLQVGPYIQIDHTDVLHVTWYSTTDNDVWYNMNNGSWAGPVALHTAGRTVFPVMALESVSGDSYNETFYLVDENNTVIETWNGDNFTDIDDLKDWTDDYVDPGGGDPLDPTPGTQGFPDEGPFTRFRMRLYFLFIGLGCIFGPLWAMAYKKFDAVGYAWCFIVMVLGTGLLWSITGI